MVRNAPVKLLVALAISAPATAVAQLSIVFQEGLNGYAGTVDTEFRAANPVDPQGEKDFVSVDEFDGGFQTQGALRFQNLFGAGPNQVPLGFTIAFATLDFNVGSTSDPEAIISFNRVLPASPWDESSTWFSLGGDLTPDPNTGLLDGDPILQDNIESLIAPDAVVPEPNVGGTKSVDVTASVTAWYNGAPNLGWAINNNTGNGWDFDSSEHIDPLIRPKLIIGYQLTAGDLDFDNDVDLFDYDILVGRIGVHLDGPIAQGAIGDLDFDRDVDLDDFGVFKDLYPGGGPGLAKALSGVPEPGTAALLISAMLSLGILRQRARD
jgi:hypothetical protein